MSICWQIVIIGTAIVVSAHIFLQKLQKNREARHPEVREMKRLLEDIRAWLNLKGISEPSPQEMESGSRLPNELANHLEQAMKLMVLCKGGPIVKKRTSQLCAVILVRRDQRQVRLAISGKVDRLVEFAHAIGRELRLPVEMV